MIDELFDRVQTTRTNAFVSLNWSEEEVANRFHHFQLKRLRAERLGATFLGRRTQPRVLATACWSFPIYSQTFVYQELAQFTRQGFDLRFLYSNLNPRNHLPAQFSTLWSVKRRLVLHPSVCERDYAYFTARMPEKVARLVEMLCRASGMPPGELRRQRHFFQAFAFTRMVEAGRPDYLHSYFFYEGTLFTLVASYLLDIPRGVSCYADHMLDDYALKVVPLHLNQCSLVIATSQRIKRELLAIAPQSDPDRIVVKPNAIDVESFPFAVRKGPEAGQPYRLVCVSRLEPKKGIIYLVEAVRTLVDRNLKVELHVLGSVDDSASSKEYAEALERRIGGLGLGGIIHLEGRMSESKVKRFLEHSDVFVAPFVETECGDKDGIPTSLLEGMSSGLPVVATDAGSITEVIDNGKDGVLVPQRNHRMLANTIEALLLDPERRQRLGREAAAKIRRHFDVRESEQIFHERVRAVIDARNGNAMQAGGRFDHG